ncbi:MAG: hypothetical protein AAGJ34_04470 [Pseudomonadota bacterium]
MTRFLFAFLLIATPALPTERIISVEEFEAISRGQTQIFERDGEFFGAEQFFSNRQTLWMFRNGQCDRGTWYPVEDLICFQYETLPEAQCWYMIERDGSYFARLQGAEPQFDLELVDITREDLPCPGPEVGS